MKKILFMLLVLIGAASAQTCVTLPFTTTTNLLLPLPVYNQCNWGSQGYNVGMARIDALFPGGILSAAHGGTGTTTGAPVISVFGMTGAIANLSGDVSTSGSSVTTLPAVNPNVGSFTAANITVDAKGRVTAAASGSGIGNLTGPITSVGPATSVAPAGVVAQKPASTTGIQYVLTTGNDSNDGFSPGTAKLTVWAALKALPGGLSSPTATAGVGTLWIGPGVSVGATDGGGLRLVGAASSPPDYTSPPTGWMRVSGALSFQCYAINNGGLFSNGPLCQETWSNNPVSMPALWLEATNSGIAFNGFNWSTQGTGIRIGVSSTGARSVGAQNIHFDNWGAQGGGSGVGWGPQVDIGSNVFWVYFHNGTATGGIAQWNASVSRSSNVVTATIVAGGVGGSTHNLQTGDHVSVFQNDADTSFNGTFTVASVPDTTHITWEQTGPNASTTGGTVMGDKDFGMVVDPADNPGSGIIDVDGYSGTGIKFYGGNSGGSMSVHNMTVEAPFIINPPAIWVSGVNAGIFASHVEIADVVGTTPDLVVDPEVSPAQAFCEFCYGLISGAMNVSGWDTYATPTQGNQNTPPTLTRNGVSGVSQGHIWAQHDGARRLFSAVAVRYLNLASTNSSGWGYNDVGGGTHTSTTGIKAPDGTLGASNITFSGSGDSTAGYTGSGGISTTVAVGDWFVGGAWVLSSTMNGYRGQAISTFIGGTGNLLSKGIGYPGMSPGAAPSGGASSWEWVWFAQKVTAAVTPSATFQIFTRFDSGHAISVYAPILIQIPVADNISDNEAADIGMHLGTYGSSCVVGTICGLPGQKLVEASFGVMGSTSGVATIVAPAAAGTPTLTLPTTTGTISETICSGTIALGTSAIGSGAAATTVTQACSGLLTTDNITLDFNASPLAVTGYTPSASGMLTIIKWPTSGQINVSVVNNTGGSITPGAITLNYRVVR